MNDLEHESQNPERSYTFEFEQDTINTIYFGNNLKGFRGNSNVLFDETGGPEQILTDLRIQSASDCKDCKPVRTQYQGPVMTCRFKVDSGAAGNLLPYNVYTELFREMSCSVLKNFINHNVCLVAYNKEEVKQYGWDTLKVNYSSKTMFLPFYVVSSKFKPIIGLDATCKLGLLTIHFPIHQSWTSNGSSSTSFDAVSGDDTKNNIHKKNISPKKNIQKYSNISKHPKINIWKYSDTSECPKINIQEYSNIPQGNVTLMKDWIVNHPKYTHLFKDIGAFKCDPVHITLSKDTVPVQKPPQRVPLALKEQFLKEIDNMVS